MNKLLLTGTKGFERLAGFNVNVHTHTESMNEQSLEKFIIYFTQNVKHDLYKWKGIDGVFAIEFHFDSWPI